MLRSAFGWWRLGFDGLVDKSKEVFLCRADLSLMRACLLTRQILFRRLLAFEQVPGQRLHIDLAEAILNPSQVINDRLDFLELHILINLKVASDMLPIEVVVFQSELLGLLLTLLPAVQVLLDEPFVFLVLVARHILSAAAIDAHLGIVSLKELFFNKRGGPLAAVSGRRGYRDFQNFFLDLLQDGSRLWVLPIGSKRRFHDSREAGSCLRLPYIRCHE